jgi:creatinine amidohydrolase
MKIAHITKDEYLALDRDRVVPIVPLGSIEQHGPHLPMGTDSLQCEAIAARAEELEPELTLVTPVLWIGNSVNHLGYRAALFIDPTRYVTVLVDIGKSFLEQGFRHLLFLNGHGANIGPLLTALHQLELEYVTKRDDVQIAGTSWWSLAPEAIAEVRDSPDDAAGHACEIETSLMLASRPELVHQELAVEGARHHPHPEWGSYDFGGSSRVMFVEMFHRAAPAGIAGLPQLATAEKGAEMIDRIAARLAEFVQDFSSW